MDAGDAPRSDDDVSEGGERSRRTPVASALPRRSEWASGVRLHHLNPVRLTSAADVVAAEASHDFSHCLLVLDSVAPPLLRAVARTPWRAVVLADVAAAGGSDAIDVALATSGRFLDPRLGPYVMDALTSETGRRNPLDELSVRERVVLRHLAEGGTNREIAQALFVSEHTVRNQLASIYRKLGVTGRAEACQAHRDYSQTDAGLG